MRRFNKKFLSHSISTTLALPFFMAGMTAQGVHAEPKHALEEVIVTARKQDENVQQVPTAMTALTSQDLADLKIQNFSQVGQTVPNLNIQTQFGSSSAPEFYLRGIATGSLKFQTDAGVALYIDGVYLGRPAGTAFDLADISRVEVLRGPQGSLFGRNSTGGAINIITAEPTGEFGGHAEVGFGNYGAQREKITINLPEYNGLAARLTYLHNEIDGYAKNEARQTFYFPTPFGTKKSASHFGMEDTNAAAVALTYTGVDNLKLDYRFDYTDKASTQMPTQLLAFYNPGGNGFLNTFFGVTSIPVPDTKRQSSLSEDFLSESKLRVQGHSLTAEYEFTDRLSLRNILAYRSLNENVGLNDIDGGAMTLANGTPFEQIASNQVRDQNQWSDELQLVGSTDELDWIGGLFWFKEKGNDNNPVFIGTAFAPNTRYVPGTTNASLFGVPDYFAGSNGSVENKSKAAFAHVTWHATDELDLAAGGRVTKDDRSEHIIIAGAVQNQSASKAFRHTDWDVSATYKLTPDFNVYGKVSTGYLTGGIINGASFDAETIKSYELGLKSQFLDNRLRMNLAAFHTNREHYQMLSFNTSNPSLPIGSYITDGGKTKQDGIELEVTAVPVEGLTLTANYGHVNDHFDNGLRSLAPKNNAYLAAQYEIMQFDNASHIDFRLDASWTDEHQQLVCLPSASPTVAGCTAITSTDAAMVAAADKAAHSDASWLVGARLTLADLPVSGNTKGRASLWAKNLTNSDKVEFSRDLGNGTLVGSFQTPRTYGVDFSVDF